ncbi:2-acyl-glycerophospho-ethanolamine acyltransferase [uncultured Clostridium sp.]|nr:2-acyl-glycerophospho-ethanolamine acyltransferase [uncultured Clostridium sp.]
MKKIETWKKTFGWILSGQAFSIIGSGAAQFALIWWITTTTGSPMALTLAAVAGFLPQALVGPFAGVWVDRLGRKAVMMAADGFVALVSAILGIGFIAGVATVEWIYAALMLRAVGTAFQMPAAQAVLPLLAPPEALTKVNGWSQFIQSGGMMAGPVLGALALEGLGMAGVMAIDVAGALLAIGTLVFIKIPELTKRAEKPHVGREMLAGLRVLTRHKALMALSIPVLLCMLVYVPVGSLFPLMVNGHFGGNAWHSSMVELAFAAGMLLCSAALGIWGGAKRQFLMISLGIAGFGVFLMVSGFLPSWAIWIFVGLSLLMGAAGNLFSVPFMAYVQGAVPPETLGRVMSMITTAMALATPVGLFIAGPVAQAIGIAPWFAYSGGAIILIGLLCQGMTRRYERGTSVLEEQTER